MIGIAIGDEVKYFIKDDVNYTISLFWTVDYQVDIWTTINLAYSNYTPYWVNQCFVCDNDATKKTYLINYDSHFLLWILEEWWAITDNKKVVLNSQISTWHSSLNIWEKYYIDDDWDYTNDSAANTTYCMIGKAISATKILVNIPFEDL